MRTLNELENTVQQLPQANRIETGTLENIILLIHQIEIARNKNFTRKKLDEFLDNYELIDYEDLVRRGVDTEDQEKVLEYLREEYNMIEWLDENGKILILKNVD